MLYYELPIFKSSYDLAIELFNFSKKLPRDFKYMIVQDLKKEKSFVVIAILKDLLLVCENLITMT